MFIGNKFWRNFDIYLFVSAVSLNILGLVTIFSHSYTTGDVRIVLSQLIYSIIGILIALILSRAEYRTLHSFASLFYYGGIVLLILVLIVGDVRNGSRAWFDLGIAGFQPSEVMKISFVLFTAAIFAKTTVHNFTQVLKSIIALVVPLGLIILQPDLGTSLAYICIWLMIILSLNLRSKQLFIIIGSAVLTTLTLLVLVLAFFPKDNFQYQRLIVYPDHLFLRDVSHQDIGYQVDQAIIAIGNGGVSGEGLNNGSQTRLGFIPESDTDFIFASIAEEVGLIASLMIVVFISIILYRSIAIARNAQDKFGRYIATGAFGFFLYHFIQNIGMNIGLLPVTGIPMSFVSYGGSHLITAYFFIGMLESVILRYKKIKY